VAAASGPPHLWKDHDRCPWIRILKSVWVLPERADIWAIDEGEAFEIPRRRLGRRMVLDPAAICAYATVLHFLSTLVSHGCNDVNDAARALSV
jgi:hypothetical protein